MGLHVDTEQAVLHWFDNYDCQCMDDGGFAEQTIAEFRQAGIPPGATELPEDVVAELAETLEAIG